MHNYVQKFPYKKTQMSYKKSVREIPSGHYRDYLYILIVIYDVVKKCVVIQAFMRWDKMRGVQDINKTAS